MLVVHNDAMCYTCKKNPRVNQPDGTEVTERWVCDAYEKKIPITIIVRAGNCDYYVEM